MTGMTQRQMIQSAAKALAGIYKQQLPPRTVWGWIVPVSVNILGEGGDMFEETLPDGTAWVLIGPHPSSLCLQAIAKYVSRVLLKGHPISNQYFVDKSDFKEDWTINWSSHHPPWKIFYTSCVFISTTLTHTVAIFSVFVYECLYLLSRLLHGLTDCVPVIFYILKVLENLLEPYLHEFIFFLKETLSKMWLTQTDPNKQRENMLTWNL